MIIAFLLLRLMMLKKLIYFIVVLCLIITIKKPPMCLHEKLLQTNYKIIESHDKPCIYLDNVCVI